MTGDSYSKKFKSQNSKVKSIRQSGQVLLIMVMLIATALTLVLSVAFKSTTDTQTTKLEEENQKALAVAEAGIEAALKNGNINSFLGGAGGFTVPSGFDGSASVNQITKTEFSSPLLQKDQQYTFYLAGYNSQTGALTPTTGSLNIYYGNGVNCDNLALEITVITGASSPYTIKKYVVSTNMNIVSGGTSLSVTIGSTTVDGVNFICGTTNPISFTTGDIMLVRNLGTASGEQTSLGFKTTGGSLPAQGNYIISEAKSPSGVTKRIQLFQSSPQIPADFFITSF